MKCLYHENCNDGMAAALAVCLARGGTQDADFSLEDYVPVQYGSAPPWQIIDGQEVVLVDFSYTRQLMEQIISRAASTLVLDHHASAERELAGLPGCVFDMERSGAMMAWDYFHPGSEPPDFFRYIQDRDLWTKRYPETDAITMYLRSYPMTLIDWERMYNTPIEHMIAEGQAISRWFDVEASKLISAWENNPTWKVISGHTFPAVNAPGFMSSEVAGRLAEQDPSGIGAVFFHVHDGVVYSLRARKNSLVDLSVVAKSMGGGGHRGAAGFKILSGDEK